MTCDTCDDTCRTCNGSGPNDCTACWGVFARPNRFLLKAKTTDKTG